MSKFKVKAMNLDMPKYLMIWDGGSIYENCKDVACGVAPCL